MATEALENTPNQKDCLPTIAHFLSNIYLTQRAPNVGGCSPTTSKFLPTVVKAWYIAVLSGSCSCRKAQLTSPLTRTLATCSEL